MIGEAHYGTAYSDNMFGEKFLGNINNMEIHDLDNEDIAANGCQIYEIIAAGHDRPIDDLYTAKQAGYNPCDKCLTGSTG